MNQKKQKQKKRCGTCMHNLVVSFNLCTYFNLTTWAWTNSTILWRGMTKKKIKNLDAQIIHRIIFTFHSYLMFIPNLFWFDSNRWNAKISIIFIYSLTVRLIIFALIKKINLTKSSWFCICSVFVSFCVTQCFQRFGCARCAMMPMNNE